MKSMRIKELSLIDSSLDGYLTLWERMMIKFPQVVFPKQPDNNIDYKFYPSQYSIYTHLTHLKQVFRYFRDVFRTKPQLRAIN